MSKDRAGHWEKVYGEKGETQLSWHQGDPAISLELCELAGITKSSGVIDVGAGTSRFAARLIARGLADVTVLDLSATAIEGARRQIGKLSDAINWVVADITNWTPGRTYDLWHDRAAFHFLVDQKDRDAYVNRLRRALRPGGHVIIATFAPDGPEKCSGLPIVRYDPESLGSALGKGFSLVTHRSDIHHTPWGSPQSFQYSLFLWQGW